MANPRRAQAGGVLDWRSGFCLGGAMTGLRRVQSRASARPLWSSFVLGGVEKITERLMRGDEFSAEDLADMKHLRMRVEAFARALDDRIAAEGTLTERSDD